jgi:hypothetical protein
VPHAGSIAPRHDAKAIVLYFVNPAWPEGGTLAGFGKHGWMIPSPGRVRSRNDMRECLGG